MKLGPFLLFFLYCIQSLGSNLWKYHLILYLMSILKQRLKEIHEFNADVMAGCKTYSS